MGRHELFLLLSTFVAGAAVGVFVYFAGYAPAEQRVTESLDGLVADIAISGEQYGGCARTGQCNAFQVASDGSFRYLDRSEANQSLQTGAVDRQVWSRIKRAVEQAPLVEYRQKTSPELCDSYVDGVDVRYRITIDSELFVLDSCGTAVDTSGELWRQLNQLWLTF